MLHTHNKQIQSFKYAKEHINDTFNVVMSADRRPRCEHEIRFNRRTLDEVAVAMVGDATKPRDNVVSHRIEGLQRICSTQ